MKRQNLKAIAWDRIGASYWNGDYQGGPAPPDIDQYLEGVDSHTKLAIIGASTRFLIGAAVERGARVLVLDFSPNMCAALREVVDLSRCEVICHDVTAPLPAQFDRLYDLLLADRLINRFTGAEVIPAMSQMLRLLNDAGEIRTAIRLGLYARDLRLIEEGRLKGTLNQFFDEKTCTIDYDKVGDGLGQLLPPHGSVPMDLVVEFYRLRGPEKRYTAEDIERYTEMISVDGRGLRISAIEKFRVINDQLLYRFRPRMIIQADQE